MSIENNIFEKAKSLSKTWQKEISSKRQKQEKKFHEMMLKMLQDPQNKLFLIELLDQSFRASSTDRIADQLEFLFSKYEDIKFFTKFDCKGDFKSPYSSTGIILLNPVLTYTGFAFCLLKSKPFSRSFQRISLPEV